MPVNIVRFSILLLFVFSQIVRATVVRPPEFDELVLMSDCVVRGTVTDLRSEWRGNGDNRSIYTIVSIQIAECLIGEAAETVELVLLGGEIDGESMTVVGQPEFNVGDEDILFIKGNGVRLCPVLAMVYGRYLVAEDETGRRFIARENGAPLVRVDEVKTPLDHRQKAGALSLKNAPSALSVESFSQAIRASARNQGRTDVATE